MNSENNKLKIQSNKANYFPGDVVKGSLRLELDKQIKARKITLKFMGEEYAIILKSSSKGYATFDDCRVMVEEETTLWPENPIDDDFQHIGPCQEVFPFEFTIPKDALPSLQAPWPYELPSIAMDKSIHSWIDSMGREGKIRWYLEAQLDRKRGKDLHCKLDFHVCSPPKTIPSSKSVTRKSTTHADQPQVVLQLDKTKFGVGEQVRGTIMFTNGPIKRTKGAVLNLEYVYSYQARGFSKEFDQPVNRLEFDESILDTKIPFQLQLPPDGPPTIQGKLVQVEWRVHASYHIKKKDESQIQIPISVYPV